MRRKASSWLELLLWLKIREIVSVGVAGWCTGWLPSIETANDWHVLWNLEAISELTLQTVGRHPSNTRSMQEVPISTLGATGYTNALRAKKFTSMYPVHFLLSPGAPDFVSHPRSVSAFRRELKGTNRGVFDPSIFPQRRLPRVYDGRRRRVVVIWAKCRLATGAIRRALSRESADDKGACGYWHAKLLLSFFMI